jgi:NAD(P)-dependent dehydrogenase (short-subunit alcohol dehydrogenase family)
VSNRVVLVTGANRGLGLEFARQYQAAGWSVIGTVRDVKAATELAAFGVHAEALDVADAESVAALARRLDGRRIDLLINNAGIYVERGERQSGFDADSFERILRVNVLGPAQVTQALLKNLRAGAGKTIVCLTSELGSIELNTSGGFYGYRESKAALNMFVRSIAAELASAGFVCIAMSPGWVKTDMGGPGAPLTPKRSVASMSKVIDNLKPADTGKCWSYDGSQLPW